VLEVFDRKDVFSVSGYGDRMSVTTGAFMLGMQEGPNYQHGHSVVLLSQPLTDLTEIRRWVRQYSQQLVDGLTRNRSSLDVVADVAYDVPVAFAGHYYGVPGPEKTVFLAWLELLAAYIFNWSAAPLKTLAATAGLEFQSYINALVIKRKADIAANVDVPQDVLTRMLQAQVNPANSLDDVSIRQNLSGLTIGCTMPPCGTLAFALDEIMNLNDANHPHYDPSAFDIIHQAACDNDETLLERCMLEAARLGSPEPPSLFRTATKDYLLAKGTSRATLIPKGSIVVAVPSSAMMDAEVIDAPDKFKIDRPRWNYLMFGDGQHECLGRSIGTILLAEAARPMLSLPNLRRASGKDGTLQMGTGFPFEFYPGHMLLEYDTH